MTDQKFDVEYLSAEDFYLKFKVFKEYLNEKGPSVLMEAVESHQFQTTSLKVCNFSKLFLIMNFILFALSLSVAFHWIWLWRHGG